MCPAHYHQKISKMYVSNFMQTNFNVQLKGGNWVNKSIVCTFRYWNWIALKRIIGVLSEWAQWLAKSYYLQSIGWLTILPNEYLRLTNILRTTSPKHLHLHTFCVIINLINTIARKTKVSNTMYHLLISFRFFIYLVEINLQFTNFIEKMKTFFIESCSQ